VSVGVLTVKTSSNCSSGLTADPGQRISLQCVSSRQRAPTKWDQTYRWVRARMRLASITPTFQSQHHLMTTGAKRFRTITRRQAVKRQEVSWLTTIHRLKAKILESVSLRATQKRACSFTVCREQLGDCNVLRNCEGFNGHTCLRDLATLSTQATRPLAH